MLRGRYENTWLALTMYTGASLNGNFAQKDWLCNNDLWSHYHLNSPKLFDVQCWKWLYGKDRENIQADFEPFKQGEVDTTTTTSSHVLKWISIATFVSWKGACRWGRQRKHDHLCSGARTGCHKLTGVVPHNPARSDSANCNRLPWKFVK